MFQGFKRLPEPLQKLIFARLGFSLLFVILLITVMTTELDIYLWLPCAGMALFFAVTAFTLFRRAVLGDYIVVDGVCTDIEFTTVKKRAKSLLLKTEECTLRVMLHGRARKYTVGSAVRIYIAKNTPLYQQNGIQMLYTYITLEITHMGEVK